MNHYFISCAPFLESLLLEEVGQFGAQSVTETRFGVHAIGDLAFAYRTCLWSRLANRVLLQLQTATIQNADDLYSVCHAIDWSEHFAANSTLWIDFIGEGAGINNTVFGAQKVKDAIVDRLRAATGQRPSIDKEEPDVCISIHLRQQQVTVYLDLSGESLHKRGYRLQAGHAPIKETLAAALLLRCQWPMLANMQKPLVDPLCGSGTILLEGLMMAADIAPGLARDYFGFLGWRQHDIPLWKTLLAQAEERKTIGLAKPLPQFYGYDADPSVISKAKAAVKQIGLDHHIKLFVGDLAKWQHDPSLTQAGLILTNPPYGHRLGNVNDLPFLYRHLATKVKEAFKGWQFALICGEDSLVKAMRLSATKKYTFKNGNIDCQLYIFDIYAADNPDSTTSTEKAPSKVYQLTDGAVMVANRIKKNLHRLAPWLKQQNINCYRVYDADIPEYAAAIDYYNGYLHIQEYAPPKTIDEEKAKQRLLEIIFAVESTFGCSNKNIITKQRRQQKGKEQYQRQNRKQSLLEVQEYQCKLLVNLNDYLDTGLFLDHRPVRRMIAKMVKAKHFLNLFCYTGTASVHAGLGGAKSTTSIDLSPTYTDWARKNLSLNGLNDYKNQVIQADCMQWLRDNRQRFDVILLDPPTFSNSKRTDATLDIQRDHSMLIELAMRALAPDGTLIFSNNFRRFKLDEPLFIRYRVEEITDKTLDPDFARDAKIHRCWLIRATDTL